MRRTISMGLLPVCVAAGLLVGLAAGPARAGTPAAGAVERFAPLWLTGRIDVPGPGFDALAADPLLAGLRPGIDLAGSGSHPAPANLAMVGAPEVWAQGYTGRGVVVAVIDSGVDVTHPDLVAGYAGSPSAWLDAVGDLDTPTDLNGHGTQVAGIAVGRAVSGTPIGVAPDARWMAARVYDRGIIRQVSAHAALRWALDPDGDPSTDDAPDVLVASWALATPGCDLRFQEDLRALRAIGILPIFAAGNEGPGEGTDRSPANNPEAFAVGNVDVSGEVDPLSSRGPGSCDRDASFPDVVAPGVDIRTSDLLGRYVVSGGTSYAAPHVAGVLALLLSAYPDLDVDTQAAALYAGARDLGGPGPDGDSGYGVVNAAASLAWLRDNVGPPISPHAPAFSTAPADRHLYDPGDTGVAYPWEAAGRGLR